LTSPLPSIYSYCPVVPGNLFPGCPLSMCHVSVEDNEWKEEEGKEGGGWLAFHYSH
jgi:hypothetical protein